MTIKMPIEPESLKEGKFETKDQSSNIYKEETNESNDPVHEFDTDLLVIGAGPGGYVAAIYAAKNGLDVTLVEKSKLGGTCLNVGCIPTKTLVKSSTISQDILGAKEFGIEIDGNIRVNMESVIQRKDNVVNRLVSGIEFLLKKNKVNVIDGHASFINKNTVQVEGRANYKVNAKNIIIATGSRISKVNIPGIDLPFVLNSTTALESSELPESITIIGGGVIGMEFAFIYKNFGVKVNVVEFLDRTLNMVDKDVSREIQKICKREKINVYTGSRVTQIQRAVNGQAEITYEDKKGEHLLVSDKVLVAIGREPNIEGLELTNSGVELNDRGRGIKVNEAMQTNVENIYAIGDVTDILQLAHVASHQAFVAVDNILNKASSMYYKAVPNVIFTSPEIATVGIGEDKAKEEGLDVAVSKVNFMGNGKAISMNETRGFVKLVKNKENEKIIGASIIGPDASSLITTLTTAIAKGMTDDEINKIIFPHPTTGEVIQEASQALGLGPIHG
jgi:dihydrolipoamide dehydrogenase